MEKRTHLVFYEFRGSWLTTKHSTSFYITDKQTLEEVKEHIEADEHIRPVKIVTLPESVTQMRRVIAAQFDLWAQRRLLEEEIGAEIDGLGDLLDDVCVGLDESPTLEPYEMLFEALNHALESADKPPLHLDDHVHEYDNDKGEWK